MTAIPANSIFNIGNSTTIRLAQYFDLDETVQVYCNRGVNGIDGCVSVAIGQAAVSPDSLNIIVVGDLTFFYDMNSIWNRHVGKNVRIMLSNNEGAALFHFNQGGKYPMLNQNVASEHFAKARGWVESQGFNYICATNKDEFDTGLTKFIDTKSNKPIFFEVFTHKDRDAELQHKFYDMNLEITAEDAAKAGAKKFIKNVLGEETLKKLRKR
jgi:2-succinyl-5-enolpyruvyl-6-hydroxy-3-cyclohexene-1-carboxylate synthase